MPFKAGRRWGKVSKILIKNGKIWDGEKFYFSDVYIECGRVAKIAQDIHMDAEFTYDANGQIVSSGLIDSHLHMRKISSDGLGVGDWACFPFGVTSAVDAWIEQDTVQEASASMVKTLGFIGTWISDNHLHTDRVEPLLKVWEEKVIGVKICFDAKDTDARDITPVREAVECAEKYGLKVMVHCNHSPVPMMEIVKALRKGDVLTHPYHGGQNNAGEDGFACLRYAKEKGVVLDAGFAGHIHTDFGVYREAVKQGCAQDTLSTDLTLWSAFKRGGRYGLTACMNIAKVCGQDEESIFKSVTSTPAKVLGKAEEWGYLKEGRTADIAVIAYEEDKYDLTDFSGNRVAWEKGYKCKLTVANGEVVFRG